MNISDDPRIKDFLKNRPLRESTITRYLVDLNIYSEVTGLTPAELIDQAEEEEDLRIRLRKRKIRKHLLNFKEELEDRNYSPTHIRNAVTNVRTFYREYGIELSKMKLSNDDSSLETYNDIPTKEQILKD